MMKLQTQHSALLSYLAVKIEAADWHAVSDVANDLRVLEAQIAMTPVTATEVFERPRPMTASPDGSRYRLQIECVSCHRTTLLLLGAGSNLFEFECQGCGHVTQMRPIGGVQPKDRTRDVDR